jgi:hypothetical protein
LIKFNHFYKNHNDNKTYFFETSTTDSKEEYYVYYPAEIKENNFLVNWSRMRVIKKKDFILDEWSDLICL